jgi:enoyl-CoA hydratase/carnithine racemase
MNETVRVAVSRGIATVSLNRPHVVNAMDGEMMRQLRPVAESVQKDSSVRAVVPRGEGPALMAGGGVAVFHRHLADLPELIVTWVVPNEKLATQILRLAQRVASGPTRANAQAKRLVNDSPDYLDAQMEQELQASPRCARGFDRKEGVSVFVEKRNAVFGGD